MRMPEEKTISVITLHCPCGRDIQLQREEILQMIASFEKGEGSGTTHFAERANQPKMGGG